MKRLLLTSIMTGGVLLFSAESYASPASTNNTKHYTKNDIIIVPDNEQNNITANYLIHINNARAALTTNDQKSARHELRRAFGDLEKLKNADGSYMTGNIKTGRTIYHYLGSDNYYYFPIEAERKLSTEDYTEPYKNTDANDLEIVYLNVNPNNTDSQNLLFIADRYIKDGDYAEADSALSELVKTTVETGKIATLPQEKAKLHLIMAKYHFSVGNSAAAINRLDNADSTLTNLLKNNAYRPHFHRLTRIRDEIQALRAKIADGAIYTEADESLIDGWISYLNEWPRV